MFASPASTTFRMSNGSTPSWSELIEPDVYCASRIARGPNRAPGPVAHGVVERRADDRDVDLAAAQLGGIGDPRQVHERRRADVRGQLVVAERLERPVPAVGRGEAGVGVGVVGALGHVIPPETGAGRRMRPRQGIRLAGGAAGSR